MTENQSIVKKTESAIDDLFDLWKRRKGICTIVIVIIVAPISFSLVQYLFAIPKLKSEIEKKDKKISQLESEKADALKAKDLAEIKLAPFWARSDKYFSEEPKDKRLDLMLKKIDELISTVQNATLERVIDQSTINLIAKNLQTLPQLNVEIVCILGDNEAFSLATQIKSIFEKAGWKVKGVTQAIFKLPVKNLVMEFRETPSKELQRAFAPLFDALGYKREASLNSKLPSKKMKIIIGSK